MKAFRKKLLARGRRQEGRRGIARRGRSYQENADLFIGLLAINMAVLLRNGDSFHDLGLQVDEWANLFESPAEIRGYFTEASTRARAESSQTARIPIELSSVIYVTQLFLCKCKGNSTLAGTQSHMLMICVTYSDVLASLL
jgi:hypothetical protein